MTKSLMKIFPLLVFLMVYTVGVGPICAMTTPENSLDGIKLYLTIDPIRDHTVGEVINIRGTTNLPANTSLWISAAPKSFTNYEPNYFIGQTQVLHGSNWNYWTILMNTSTFSIDEYTLHVQSQTKDPILISTQFNITPPVLSTPQPIFQKSTPGVISKKPSENTNHTDSLEITHSTPSSSLFPAFAIVALGILVLGRKIRRE